MKNKGFTLIELLVTITVIAVLVLLAAPQLLGYTDKAKVAELTVNTREIETAAERYYMDHDDWPRLTDEPYTDVEVKAFAKKIYDITGEEVSLDPDGNYYDIDFEKLKPYIDVPGEKANYILQNPVGKVYALYKPTEEAIKRLDKEEPLYEFDSFTFTNAGATGRFGPTQAQLDSAYAGSILEGKVISDAGIQLWTVPKSGTYRIETYGAQGGRSGGKGAIMKGDFFLKQGLTMSILIGQEGLYSGYGGGGGGGSFVVKDKEPLIISGGGGGNSKVFVEGNGRIETSGGIGYNSNQERADNGEGGKSSLAWGSSGGGGFYFDGNGYGNREAYAGKSFFNSGTGGYGKGGLAHGGFGGGGGGFLGNTSQKGGGGAGGYSGGNASDGYSLYYGGGGGGSYNSGTNQENSVGNTGHGKVIITYLGK